MQRASRRAKTVVRKSPRAQIAESYVVPTRSEFFLLNSNFVPLISMSTHVEANLSRSRKLLLTARKICRLLSKVRETGLTLAPLNMHFSRGRRQRDKRQDKQKRNWQ